MKLEMIGLNHGNATLSMRERAAISPDAMPTLLEHLVRHPNTEAAAILSTCSRAELPHTPMFLF